MQDLETRSLWSQISGECIKGALIGKKLELYPVLHSTYEEYKRVYPNGKLLDKPEKGENGSVYNSYFSNSEKLGIFGRQDNFDELDGKDQVFGIRLGDWALAVSVDYLKRQRYFIINEDIGSAIIIFNHENKTATAFSLMGLKAKERGKIKLTDDYSMLSVEGQRWNATTGQLIEEDGNNLPILPITPAFWFAWISFFPETELIK